MLSSLAGSQWLAPPYFALFSHEDVGKDNGETVELGHLRTQPHNYYRHPAAKAKAKKVDSAA